MWGLVIGGKRKSKNMWNGGIEDKGGIRLDDNGFEGLNLDENIRKRERIEENGMW